MTRFYRLAEAMAIFLALTAVSIVIALLAKEAKDLAAWVQAIGSIVAIMAAFEIANAQLREQRMHERTREREDAQRKIRTLRSLLCRVKELAATIAVSEGPVSREQPQYAAIHDLGLLQALLERLPIFEVPLDELILRFHRIQQLIPMLCNEFNQVRVLDHPQDSDRRDQCRNSARRHLKEIQQATDELIALCDDQLAGMR